jgi:hypothetical protein
LFVPSATCGGRPAHSNAGTEIKPPPPAMESMKPALRPAQKRSVIVSPFMAGMESGRSQVGKIDSGLLE